MRLSLALVVLLSCGCAGHPSTTTPPIPESNEKLAELERDRAKARAGDHFALRYFVQDLIGAQSSDEAEAEYGEVDWTALNQDAERMLDQWMASADAENLAKAMQLKAELLLATGRANEAVAGYAAWYERAPNFDSALGLMWTHWKAKVPMADAPGFCAANRELAVGNEQVFPYLLICALLNPSDSPATSLPWASDADLQLLAEGIAAIQELAAWLAGEKRRSDRSSGSTGD